MAERCITDCELKKFAEESKKILLDTAKNMHLSEDSTKKLEQFFLSTYEDIKRRGGCPQKGQCEDIRKKFQEDSIKYLKGIVIDQDKDLIENVIKAAFLEINKLQA